MGKPKTKTVSAPEDELLELRKDRESLIRVELALSVLRRNPVFGGVVEIIDDAISGKSGGE